MSPMSQQQWARRVRYSDQHIRVSDAERNAVAEILGQHYADGRLDQGEFDERIGQTMGAKTRGDLAGLFDDLPDVEGAQSPAGRPSGGRGPSGPPLPYRPRRRGGFGLLRAIALIALVIILTNVAWHAFTSLFFVGPVLWGICLAAIILLVMRGTHHHRDR